MNKVFLSLDSGAFSFYKRDFMKIEDERRHLNLAIRRRTSDYSRYAKSPTFVRYLDAYAEYLSEFGEDYLFYVGLDVIGSAQYTYDAVRYLESCGLSPVPVFHYGEDLSWLRKYADNYEYIGLGGMGGKVTKKLFIPFGDRCFRYFSNDAYVPSVKVHGFAVTSYDLLLRYPWYSVDSSTWTALARNGGIYVPTPDGKGFTYIKKPLHVRFTERALHTKLGFNRHGDSVKRIIERYVEELGLTLEDLKDYFPRDLANAAFMLRLGDELRDYWKDKNGWDGPRLYLAGNSSYGISHVDNALDFFNGLLDLDLTPYMLVTYFYQPTMNCYKRAAEEINNE